MKCSLVCHYSTVRTRYDTTPYCCPPTHSLMLSYTKKLMALPGAMAPTRATHPVISAAAPSFAAMSLITPNTPTLLDNDDDDDADVDAAAAATADDLPEEEAEEAEEEEDSTRKVCNLVLARSMGFVATVATAAAAVAHPLLTMGGKSTPLPSPRVPYTCTDRAFRPCSYVTK